MPVSATTPGHLSTCESALRRVAFRIVDGVGTRDINTIAAQWLAYAFPYRRFADTLADACARLGADADRYSFIAVDLHHLLLAGLPAHFESYHPSHAVRCSGFSMTATRATWGAASLSTSSDFTATLSGGCAAGCGPRQGRLALRPP
jgi:hypothetical protein